MLPGVLFAFFSCSLLVVACAGSFWFVLVAGGGCYAGLCIQLFNVVG